MDSIRKSQLYASDSVSARNLPKRDLAGVIFGCKNNTMEECLTKQLFGLPQIHFSYIRNIEKGLPLFLFNYDERKLYGIFEVASGGRLNSNSYAWTDGSKRTPFPAQVSVRIRIKCRPLSEDQFKRVLEKNYFNHRRFWFELDWSQTRALTDLFRPAPSSECTKLIHWRNNILAASQATRSMVTSNDESMLVKSNDIDLPVNLANGNIFPLLGEEKNTKPENLISQGRTYADVCKRETTSHYNLVDQNNFVSHSWVDEHIENRSIGKTPSSGPECLESEKPVPDWEEWTQENAQMNPSHACNPLTEDSQLYHRVSDSPLEPKELMLSILKKLDIGNQCSTIYGEQVLTAKVSGPECLESKEPLSDWEELTQENAQVNPSDACNPLTEDSLLYNRVSDNPLKPKEMMPSNLEKLGIGLQCSTSHKKQVLTAKVSGPECLESEEPVSGWEEKTQENAQINPSDACNPLTEDSLLYNRVSDNPLKPKEMMSSNLEKLDIGLRRSTSYEEQVLTAKVSGPECLESEEPVSDWEERTQENAKINPSAACNPLTEDSLLYNRVSNNPLNPKELMLSILEKLDISQCPTSYEEQEQVLIAREHRESASLSLYENTESLQSLIRVKEGKLTMEKKQIELCQDIQRLRNSLIEKERKIQHLSNRVKELELKLDSSLAYGDSPNLCAQQSLGSENSIYILGGFNGISWLSALDAFSPSSGKLTTLRPMKFAHIYASAVALDGNIYTFGGGDGSSWYNTVECYNRRDDQWSSCASLIRKKGCLAGATLHGKIYAIGGGDGSGCFSDVEVYDPALGKWIFGQSMLKKRFAPAAVELNGAIYAVGGYEGHDYLKLAERYDPREPHWKKIPSMNTRRGCHTLAVLNERLHVAGGYDGDHMVSSLEVFDPRMPSWVITESMKDIRGCCAAAVLDSTLLVIGGMKDGDTILDTVESYKEGIGWQNTGLKSVGKRCFSSAIVI